MLEQVWEAQKKNKGKIVQPAQPKKSGHKVPKLLPFNKKTIDPIEFTRRRQKHITCKGKKCVPVGMGGIQKLAMFSGLTKLS